MKRNDGARMEQRLSIVADDNLTVSNKNMDHSTVKEYIREHMVMSNINAENGLNTTYDSQRTNSDSCSVNYIRKTISGIG